MRLVRTNRTHTDAVRFAEKSRATRFANTITYIIKLILFGATLAAASLKAQTTPSIPGGSTGATPFATGKVYSFERISDGVYYATSRTPEVMNTGSNDIVIVNESGVMLVDDGRTPAAGRALLEDMKLITSKPVRWVVNTHYHYDHTSGNSVFGPDVEIIALQYVRDVLLKDDWQHEDPYAVSEVIQARLVDKLKKQVADEKDAERRTVLEKQLAEAQNDQATLEQLKTTKATPPTITYSSKMVFYDGQREIQLLDLGGGHTQGDTVVFLPKEKIVCTGDLMEGYANGPSISYMGNAAFGAWIASLKALNKLDFDTVLPGHGEPFHGKTYISEWQSYLEDLVSQVTVLRKQGLSAAQAAEKVDLTSHKADFPNDQARFKGPGIDLRSVQRLYEWMDESSR